MKDIRASGTGVYLLEFTNINEGEYQSDLTPAEIYDLVRNGVMVVAEISADPTNPDDTINRQITLAYLVEVEPSTVAVFMVIGKTPGGRLMMDPNGHVLEFS